MHKNYLLVISLGLITGFKLNIGLNVNIQFSEPIKFNYEKEFINKLSNLKKTKEVEHLLNNQEWIQGYVYKKFYFKSDYIFIEQSVPIGVLNNEFFLAKNKNIFPVDSISNSLPRFRVPENKTDELINLFLFIDDKVQKNQTLISEINYDFGSGWEIILNNGQKIIFARNLTSQSMERFQILMRYLYANRLNPSIIDMRNKSGAALKYGN